MGIKKDKLCTNPDEILWKEREMTGDFEITSKEDQKTTKYHSAILYRIPHFKEIIKKGEKKQENIEISSSSFESFMKYIYLNQMGHFSVCESIELLNDKSGIYFFFSEKKKSKKNPSQNAENRFEEHKLLHQISNLNETEQILEVENSNFEDKKKFLVSVSNLIENLFFNSESQNNNKRKRIETLESQNLDLSEHKEKITSYSSTINFLLHFIIKNVEDQQKIFTLATYFELGQHISQNLELAAKLYQNAASKGIFLIFFF